MKKLLLVVCVMLAAGAVSAQSKLAHLDTQKIMESLPEYKEAVDQLALYEEEGVKELQVMEADFQAALERYQKGVTSGDWSPVIQDIEKGKVEKKGQAIDERQKSLQEELQKVSLDLNSKIQKIINDAVKIVSDRHSYDYVFDITMFVIANGSDITEEVLTEIKKAQPATAGGGGL